MAQLQSVLRLLQPLGTYMIQTQTESDILAAYSAAQGEPLIMMADTGANIHIICPRHRQYMIDLVENPGIPVDTAGGVVALQIVG